MSYRQQFMDRRRVVRQPTGIEARVQVPLRAPITCLITNISPHGAMIVLDRLEHLPNTFRIDIDGFETTVSVVHRNRNVIGLAFATPFANAYDYAIPDMSAAA